MAQLEMNKKAEEIRIRYLYRRLILKDELTLPVEIARKLIGPDCAYHLYSVARPSNLEEKTPGSVPAGTSRLRAT